MSKEALANRLAYAFLGGDASVPEIVRRSTAMLDRSWNWLWPAARNYVQAMSDRTRPRHGDVVEFILSDPVFERARAKYSQKLVPRVWLYEPQRMQPVAAAREWDLPRIETVGELADWFWLEPSQLDWLADLKGLGCKSRISKLRHYHYRALKKQSGGFRLIESPKPRLKDSQRQILEEILNKIPPHPAAHGFVKGRSILSFAGPHVGRHVVVRLDLEDFFPSFRGARVQTLFRTIGYPESVADLLGGICTTATPPEIWRTAGAEIYSSRHLPQGAPTSPALANLCAYRMDCRLAGLARSAGAGYTRYADDLVFSGGPDFARGAEAFSTSAASILLDEGLTVHHRKTRIMRQAVRQHLAGLVTNERLNVRRSDFDHLKATLTNCVRQGTESQNHEGHTAYRAHLDGRIGFVEMVNPAKGAKLRAIFDRIIWE